VRAKTQERVVLNLISLAFSQTPAYNVSRHIQLVVVVVVALRWNSLPNIVTVAESLASFKSGLKTHLINQTFS